VKIIHSYVRRLALTSAQVEALDAQAHAARALWNLLHDWATGHGSCHRRSLKDADTRSGGSAAGLPSTSRRPDTWP
jgi:putative transposase